MEGFGTWILLVGVAGCIVCLGWAVVEDLRRRVIPRASCYGIALCGAAVQVAAYGLPGLCWGLGLSVVAVALCACSSWAVAAAGSLTRRSHAGGSGGSAGASEAEPPIGGGDVRLIAALCVATGQAAPFGVVLCAAGTALVCAAGLATGKLRWRDGIPYAPFLALWPIGSVLLGP